MKRKFNISWKSSRQPRKQRKYLANAPIHHKKKMISSNLSKELRKKYKKRSLPVRKGDVVKIMRGKFRGKKGKIVDVNVKLQKVEIEGIQVKKQDGSKVNVKLEPSNLQIVELNLEDRKRNKIFVKEEKRETHPSVAELRETRPGETELKETRPSVAELKKTENTGGKK